MEKFLFSKFQVYFRSQNNRYITVIFPGVFLEFTSMQLALMSTIGFARYRNGLGLALVTNIYFHYLMPKYFTVTYNYYIMLKINK